MTLDYELGVRVRCCATYCGILPNMAFCRDALGNNAGSSFRQCYSGGVSRPKGSEEKVSPG